MDELEGNLGADRIGFEHRLLARLDRLEANLLKGFSDCTARVEALLNGVQQELLSSLEERITVPEDWVNLPAPKQATRSQKNARLATSRGKRPPSIQ